jgi:hypothetical protein
MRSFKFPATGNNNLASAVACEVLPTQAEVPKYGNQVQHMEYTVTDLLKAVIYGAREPCS